MTKIPNRMTLKKGHFDFGGPGFREVVSRFALILTKPDIEGEDICLVKTPFYCYMKSPM
jgi:hypothetical protein